MNTDLNALLEVKNTLQIKATAKDVWGWLVNPEKTKAYMFGCEARSNWQPGSELLWVGMYQGAEMVFVKGKVLEIIPERLLRYTVIDPHGGYEDVDRNYLQVSYFLEETTGETQLTVLQNGFENADNGQKRYEETYNNGEGWQPILTSIKNLAEAETTS